MSQIDVSIIVLSYNTRELLRKCIKSIYDTTKRISFEVICIDDNSFDNSADMIEKEFPQVTLIRNKTNLVYSKSNNIGMRISKGRYVVLLNSDVLILKDVFDEMVQFMDTRPEAGVASCKLINPDGSIQYCVRRLPNLTTAFFQSIGWHNLFPNSKITNKYYQKQLDYDTVFKADSIGTTCFMIRRELLNTVGYLDEQFPLFFTDLDYNKRIRDMGYDIYYIPHIKIIHYGGQSINQQTYKQLIEQHKGIYRFYKKHYSHESFFIKNYFVYSAILARLAVKLALNAFSRDKRVIKSPGAPKKPNIYK